MAVLINQPNDGTLILSLSNTKSGAGYRVESGSDLIGSTILSLTWNLRRFGTPPAGDIEARVYTSPTAYTVIGDPLAQTSINNAAQQDYTFTSLTGQVISEGDYIVCWSTNGGTASSDIVKIYGESGCDNLTAGTDIAYTQNESGTWNDDDDLCLSYGQIRCYGTGTLAGSNFVGLPPPPLIARF